MTTVAYRADLAHIHDDSFGFIAEGAARTLLERLHYQGVSKGLIVELAVGSGISSELFTEAGFDVLGYDISPDMIAIAKQRAPKAKFEVASLYDAKIPRCVAVTGIGEAFNYTFDERAGFSAMKGVFEKAFKALKPRGILMFDVAQPGRAQPRMESHYWEGDGWKVTSETVESPSDHMLHRKITSRRVQNGAERAETELHELALYDHEAVFGALKAAGFIPHTLATYADLYRFGVGHGAFVAYKPPN